MTYEDQVAPRPRVVHDRVRRRHLRLVTDCYFDLGNPRANA